MCFDPFFTHFWSQNGPFSRHFGIFHGPKRVTTGSKRAENTCLSIPNGLGSLLEKCVFDSFLTHFWSQNGPFSRHFGILAGPKCGTTGSKWARNTCLSIPHGPGSLLEKHLFEPFFTHFWSQISPFSRHFGILHGPKRLTAGSKRAKNTCLSIPNGLGSLLEKCVFDPFLTHFWSQNGPFSRHFGILAGPKCGTAGSKWARNTCLSIPHGPGSLLEKHPFDPFLTHFWSQISPFSRHFGILHGPKRITTGSKWAKNTCLSIPNGPGSLLEKCVFDPFFTHFWSQKRPPFKTFWDFPWPKTRHHELKMG